MKEYYTRDELKSFIIEIVKGRELTRTIDTKPMYHQELHPVPTKLSAATLKKIHDNEHAEMNKQAENTQFSAAKAFLFSREKNSGKHKYTKKGRFYDFVNKAQRKLSDVHQDTKHMVQHMYIHVRQHEGSSALGALQELDPRRTYYNTHMDRWDPHQKNTNYVSKRHLPDDFDERLAKRLKTTQEIKRRLKHLETDIPRKRGQPPGEDEIEYTDTDNFREFRKAKKKKKLIRGK